MFGQYPSGEEPTFDLDSFETDSPLPLYMLTNKQKTKGALILIADGIAKQSMQSVIQERITKNTVEIVLETKE